MPTMDTSTSRQVSRPRRQACAGLALALMAGLGAGCSTMGSTQAILADHHYQKRHPIMISEEPEVFTLPVGMNGPAVSHEIEVALGSFVDAYYAEGAGALTIQAPKAAANESAATSTGRALHYSLVRAGVPRDRIQVVPYYVGDHAKVAPVRLSYLKVKAVAPRCGVWPETTSGSHRNIQLHNHGCASQQNLAAMVDNPADFVRPRDMSPANGARRARVIKLYQDTGNTGWEPAPETKLLQNSSLGGL